MQIEFYITDSPRKRVTKNVSNRRVLTGTLRAQSSVMSPVFTIEDDGTIIGYNYCYISTFKRWYYVKNITAVRNNVFEIELEIDVLMTYAGEIRSNTALIDRTENGTPANVYINNGTFVNSSKERTATYNFSGGFNDSPEYILITAGGI